MTKKVDQTASFMVRFNQIIFEDNGESKVQWRGKVSHVQGGDDQSFSDFNEAVAFIQKKLAELTLEATKHESPEQQDSLLKKSFSLWKTISKEGPKVIRETLKDPKKQVANIQEQISYLGDEMMEKVQIDQWRNASRSDFNTMKESLSQLASEMKKLNAKVDAMATDSKAKPTSKTTKKPVVKSKAKRTVTKKLLKRSRNFMAQPSDRLQELIAFKERATIHIQTLGQFNVWLSNEKLDAKKWGRDKTVQLFQYLISQRQRHALHKERIMEHLWEEAEDRDFKVALHGINKVLEPDRPSRTDPKYVIRQGISYQLDMNHIWIDAEALEQYIILGNACLGTDNKLAKAAYEHAIELYQGVYLPNRIYEDWSSEEREKIQILILGAYVTLAEIILDDNPLETIRLAQKAIAIDATWEDAYRLQMQAYIGKGNRPQALKAYQKCADVLDAEYGIEPLPQTKNLLKEIESIG